MKRILSLVVVLVLAISSAAWAAPDTEAAGAAGLAARLAESLAGLGSSRGFTFDYTRDDGRVSGGIRLDAGGMPVIEGGVYGYGDDLGVRISDEGLALTLPEGTRGIAWESMLALLLKEVDLDGLMDLRPEDLALIRDMADLIAGSITAEALSVYSETVPAAGGTMGRITCSVDMGKLATELDTAVIHSLAIHAGAIDAMLGRCEKLMAQLGLPGGLSASDIVSAWTGMGLSSLPLKGMKAQLVCTHGGSIDRPWEIRFSTLGLKACLAYDGGGICLEVSPAFGEKLVFDSRDAAYLIKLALSAVNSVTPEALGYVNEVSGGMRRIAFNMVPERLEKQLAAGLALAISSNRGEIDALIDKYRPWLMLIDPAEGAAFTTDSLIKAFTAGYMRGSLSYRPGMAANPVRLNICLPVETRDGYGAQAAGRAGYSGDSIAFDLESGYTRIHFLIEENHLEAEYRSYYRNRQITLRADTDHAGKMMTATLSGRYHNRTYFTLTLEAGEEGLRLYSDDGYTDVRLTFTESGAEISGEIDGNALTGAFTVGNGLWKLSLSDGYDTLDVTLRVGGGSFSLACGIGGESLAIDGAIGPDRFSASLSAGNLQASLSVENTGYGLEAEAAFSKNYVTHTSRVRVDESGFGCRIMHQSYRSMMRNFDLEVNLSVDGEDPGLDIFLENMQYGALSLCLRRNHALVLTPRSMVTVEDISPEGSAGASALRVSVYDGLAILRNGIGQAADEACCRRYTLTAQAAGEVYRFALSDEDGEIRALTLDFDPDAAKPLPADTLWISADRYLLMAGAPTPRYDKADGDDEGPTTEETGRIQRLLSDAGFAPEGAQPGVYDEATTRATADFQAWINEMCLGEILSVTGKADAETLSYLEYCADYRITRNSAAGA